MGTRKLPLPARPNRFLQALDAISRHEILSRSTQVDLSTESSLSPPNLPSKFACFLASGVASMMGSLEDGQAIQVSMSGTEGVIGAIALLGSMNPATEYKMDTDAIAYRIPMSDLQVLFEARPKIRTRLLEFVQYETIVITQLAACNALHELSPRMARCLAMFQDRVGTDELLLTHEHLSEMLGTRRTTVTLALRDLERAGIVTCFRGRIKVSDRNGLEKFTCACYPTLRDRERNLYSDSGEAPRGFPHTLSHA